MGHHQIRFAWPFWGAAFEVSQTSASDARKLERTSIVREALLIRAGFAQDRFVFKLENVNLIDQKDEQIVALILSAKRAKNHALCQKAPMK